LIVSARIASAAFTGEDICAGPTAGQDLETVNKGE
jgi:hypothetical protein